jgi:hypothetical protein
MYRPSRRCRKAGTCRVTPACLPEFLFSGYPNHRDIGREYPLFNREGEVVFSAEGRYRAGEDLLGLPNSHPLQFPGRKRNR